MVNKIIIVLMLLLLSSCSSDPFMRKEFGNNPRILIDPITNKRYIISHRIGDIYNVEPLDKNTIYKAIRKLNEE